MGHVTDAKATPPPTESAQAPEVQHCAYEDALFSVCRPIHAGLWSREPQSVLVPPPRGQWGSANLTGLICEFI